METETKKPAENDMQNQMEEITKMLAEQKEHGRRMEKAKRTQNKLLLCLVAVFAVGFLGLNLIAGRATKQIPQLVQTVNDTVLQSGEKLNDILTSMDEVDFEALNSAIQEMDEGLAAIDFEALAKSIEDLQESAENMKKIFGIFG